MRNELRVGVAISLMVLLTGAIIYHNEVGVSRRVERHGDFFDGKVALAGGGDCPVGKCDTKEEVMAMVKVFDNYMVSRQFGFKFGCVNPEDEKPVLDCFSRLSREKCLGKIEVIQYLVDSMSVEWDIYTGCKEVNFHDEDGVVIYCIDSEGIFYCTLGDLL